MNKPEKHLSIVVPVFNEQNNISLLHQEIAQVCTELGYIFEIIIVDDGSTDKTGQIARTLSPVKYIRLRRNFGQTLALDAGIKAASNKCTSTRDHDFQNPPRDIPRLIKHLEEHGYDSVSWRRKFRQDGFVKKVVPRCYRSLIWSHLGVTIMRPPDGHRNGAT